MRYAKVKDKPELRRDMRSKAIINTGDNRAELRAARAKELKSIQEMSNLKEDVSKIKNQIGELSNLVKQLLEKE